jgi:RNA polymerase sigma-70 factor (ECF subfamily)
MGEYMGNQLKKITDEQDAGAFRSLFLTFCPKVRAMLMRQGADRETAEEIAQDTMLTVWRKSHQFSNARGSVSAWIYTIARNLRIDRVRQQAVWQRCHEEFETMERLQPSADEPRSWERERDEIEGALGGLPPEQLQVIQLSFVDGLSQSAIAARLDLPLGTVKSRMRLAFDKLRCSAERRA